MWRPGTGEATADRRKQGGNVAFGPSGPSSAHRLPWHRLYLYPEPHGQGSFRPTLDPPVCSANCIVKIGTSSGRLFVAETVSGGLVRNAQRGKPADQPNADTGSGPDEQVRVGVEFEWRAHNAAPSDIG